jgi:dipeptidyl aminopeptidase/acylaminoacyl peptidase
VLHRTGVAWYGVASDIWISDLEIGGGRSLTGGQGNNWAPSWSPDGKYLAFLSDRGSKEPIGPARLWVWERQTDTLRQVGEADVREGFAGLHWVGNGHSVLVSLFPEELGRDGFAAVRKAPRRDSKAGVTARSSSSILGVDACSHRSGEPRFLASRPRPGRCRNQGPAPAGQGARVGSYALAPNHTALRYTVLTRPEKPGTGQYLFEVIVHDLRTDTTRVVAPDVRLDLFASSFSWSPASDAVAYRSAGPLAEDDIYVVAREGRPARLVAHNPKVDPLGLEEIDQPVWDPAGRGVFFTRKGVMWRVAADGSGAAAFATLADHELQIISRGSEVCSLQTGGDRAS